MIDLAKVAREKLVKAKTRLAVPVLKEEIYLEDSIRNSIDSGMSFTYVKITELVNDVKVVMNALESFGYGSEITYTGELIKVWW